MASDPLAFFRSLPDLDVGHIKGNVSLEDKNLNAKVLKYFVASKPCFGTDIGHRLGITDINLFRGPGNRLEAETILEIGVEEDMCNAWKSLHGACAAYLADVGALGPLIVLGTATGRNTVGMAATMNLIFHDAPQLGAQLKIVNTSITLQGLLMTSRSEIRDKVSEKVYVSGVLNSVRVPPADALKRANKL
ncbi:hypothetical protein SERLA73DRAFT_178181 [Serpula lacrymans var. lacrymans S7.3]|uniref:Thioesterase domain-containing protein n=2 Tax=Serpula lacrymans var. lacrymans TaxID=341189 RepID=F8PQW5_SERL3|nr:uncharacterized protein SERLADRAFT_481198 [Serpula lacrymans var. lacrymans S7.9]EGO02309.1 hypothetical protein SERLA73DRAFT_178181 [Serpula lacrymans var. lacrymans S7.3]EGO18367.1 hypothetical protein SERLADRAFT_481198 [Serpula lacrymans var. lacrymans S7.9]